MPFHSTDETVLDRTKDDIDSLDDAQDRLDDFRTCEVARRVVAQVTGLSTLELAKLDVLLSDTDGEAPLAGFVESTTTDDVLTLDASGDGKPSTDRLTDKTIHGIITRELRIRGMLLSRSKFDFRQSNMPIRISSFEAINQPVGRYGVLNNDVPTHAVGNVRGKAILGEEHMEMGTYHAAVVDVQESDSNAVVTVELCDSHSPRVTFEVPKWSAKLFDVMRYITVSSRSSDCILHPIIDTFREEPRVRGDIGLEKERPKPAAAPQFESERESEPWR